MGKSSPRISSRPEFGESPVRADRSLHVSLPTSQSNDSVCRARRFGTSSGSRIFATTSGAVLPEFPNPFFSGFNRL